MCAQGDSQPTGKGLKINPQVSSLRTVQNPKTEPRKTENRRPTNSDAKTRPAGLLPRNLPNLHHLRELWLKMQKQTLVCLSVCLGQICKHVSLQNEVQNKSN